MGAVLYQPLSLKYFKHHTEVLANLEAELVNRGITELYSLVSDVGRLRYAEAMGFHGTDIMLTNGMEVVRKDLLA